MNTNYAGGRGRSVILSGIIGLLLGELAEVFGGAISDATAHCSMVCIGAEVFALVGGGIGLVLGVLIGVLMWAVRTE